MAVLFQENEFKMMLQGQTMCTNKKRFISVRFVVGFVFVNAELKRLQ